MLRNAAKKVDLPLQLKKAKEMLFSVQEQLATAKQETLRRAVQTGVASMQPEMDTIKQLVEQYGQCKKRVDELTRELNASNSTTSSSFHLCVSIKYRWKKRKEGPIQRDFRTNKAL